MKRTLVIILLTALLLAGCGVLRAAKAPEAPVMAEPVFVGGVPEKIQPEMGAPRAPAEMPMPTPAMAYDTGKGGGGGEPTTDRKIIKNVDLAIVVPDPKVKMDVIARLADQMGGYLVSSNLYQTYTPRGDSAPEASIVIRVPALKLEDALTQIKADVVEVQSETRSGQDVTQEYVDLKSRLKNLEAAERQLTKIMENATETEDVLAVFNQLTYYREQIEIVKGQLQYYDAVTDYATISVRIVAEETIKPIEIGGWKPQGVARDAIQALVKFLQGFVDFLIWLVLYILPIALLIFIPLWLIWRGARKWLAKRKAQKTPPAG